MTPPPSPFRVKHLIAVSSRWPRGPLVNYLLQAISVKLIGLGMPLFYWPYLGGVRQETNVMFIKDHM